MLKASSAQHDEILLVFDVTVINNKIIQQNLSYDTVWQTNMNAGWPTSGTTFSTAVTHWYLKTNRKSQLQHKCACNRAEYSHLNVSESSASKNKSQAAVYWYSGTWELQQLHASCTCLTEILRVKRKTSSHSFHCFGRTDESNKYLCKHICLLSCSITLCLCCGKLSPSILPAVNSDGRKNGNIVLICTLCVSCCGKRHTRNKDLNSTFWLYCVT